MVGCEFCFAFLNYFLFAEVKPFDGQRGPESKVHRIAFIFVVVVIFKFWDCVDFHIYLSGFKFNHQACIPFELAFLTHFDSLMLRSQTKTMLTFILAKFLYL